MIVKLAFQILLKTVFRTHATKVAALISLSQSDRIQEVLKIVSAQHLLQPLNHVLSWMNHHKNVGNIPRKYLPSAQRYVESAIIYNMNPYEEPSADLYQPTATGAGTAWIRIGIAGVGYWLAYVGVKTLTTWNADERLVYFTMLGFSFVVGPMIGAIFLATGVHHRWLLHGLLFAFLLAASYTIAIYVIHGPIPWPALAGITIAWSLIGLPTVLLSMSLTRLARRASGKN